MKTFNITIPKKIFTNIRLWADRYLLRIIVLTLITISIVSSRVFLQNGLALSYNDARSHLDIGRRVVENLKPGLAQLGSVWLPLNHILMLPTVWNDYMWHSGLSGTIQSMIGFVTTGILIYLLLRQLHVGLTGRLVGVIVFTANLNILYLQSTAMTELLLLATMTAGTYYLVLWHKDENVLHLITSAFWIMLATLTRYDGWFLLLYAAVLILLQTLRKHGYKTAEGTVLLYLTLGVFGIVLWFLWNQLIYKDALYFIYGPFSAHAQQQLLTKAGVLMTSKNLGLSVKVYLYALLYNAYTIPVLLAAIGALVLMLDKKISVSMKWGTTALLTPFVFNILALYLGFSVLYIQGISGNTWFNVRYGIMMAPTIAIFIGYLVDRAVYFRTLIIGVLCFLLFFAFINKDAVTIDDARVGSSQTNVSQVASYLAHHAKDENGFILISVASHDAVIFSSGLPMSRYIHEGTGTYWTNALKSPDQWARWIVMRTNDIYDLTWKGVSKTPGFAKYHKVASFPFADVYELNPQFVGQLHTTAILGKLN